MFTSARAKPMSTTRASAFFVLLAETLPLFRGFGQAPADLCGVYEAPACAELTPNSSVFLDVRQTLRTNGSFAEEGAWAPGQCRQSSENGIAGVAHYRLWGSFRDHGSDLRRGETGVRKLVIDIQGVVVMLMPGSAALELWRKACPCGGRSWKALEEVDVMARCSDSCVPFSARSIYLVYSIQENRKLCISPRRSFDERWPLRQKLTSCLSKESQMECRWKPPRRGPALSADIKDAIAHFHSMSFSVTMLSDVPITAVAAHITMKEDGSYNEEISWVLGEPTQQPHFQTRASGRWHHHGEHTFAPGMAKLHLELSKVTSSLHASQVCLKEGCAAPGVVLRLVCPCETGLWSSRSSSNDLHPCLSPSCALSRIFTMESFLLGGNRPDGTLCLSARWGDRYYGWGINNTNSLACSGETAVHEANFEYRQDIPTISTTDEHDMRTTTTTTVQPSSILDGMKRILEQESSARSQRKKTAAPRHSEPQRQVEEHAYRNYQHSSTSRLTHVLAFDDTGFTGQKHKMNVGQHIVRSMPLAAVRSLLIPAGWHVNVLAPLQLQSGRVISEAAQLIRALIFDVTNLTQRVSAARPWTGNEGLAELETQLRFEVRKLDLDTTQGARLSTAACSQPNGADDETRILSLQGESSETFQVFDGPRPWLSISVDDGFHVSVDPTRGEPAVIDLVGTSSGASCANFTKPPKTIELEPDCSAWNQCSGHGICRRPHECVCRMMDGWIGKSCNLQVPDRSSAVVCDSVIAFVGAPLQCTVHVRRQYEPTLASAEVLSISLRDDQLGSLKMDTPSVNATVIVATFWPRKTWDTPVRLLNLKTPYDFLADLSRAFQTEVRAVSPPSMSSSCEIRAEMDDGNFRCSFDFKHVTSKQPLPVPLRLLSVTIVGGAVSQLRCAGSGARGLSLCSRAIADIETFVSSAVLTAVLRPPSDTATAVAKQELKLHGPTRACTPDMLLSIGLPRNLPQRLCKTSLQLACAGAGVSKSDTKLGPAAQLSLAEEALDGGHARAALQASSMAHKAAKACLTYGINSTTENFAVMFRSSGIRASVDWNLLGHIQTARDVAESCVRSARGDRDTELWSRRCAEVFGAVNAAQHGADAISGVLATRRWHDVLPGHLDGSQFAQILSTIMKAVAVLPASWRHGLDAEGATQAREWTLELHIGVCLGRAASAKTESKNTSLALNLTLESCAAALSVMDAAQKRWPYTKTFADEVVTWQVRVYLIRAEWLFAHEEYKVAMRDVMKALALPNVDQALDHDRLTQLLRRIVRARSEQRASGGGTSWDFPTEEEDEQETSYYDVLGVARNASDAEVKRAYRQLALKWHPDKHPDDKDRAEAMFISITEAYEYIIADVERQRRAGQPSEPQAPGSKDVQQAETEDATQDDGEDDHSAKSHRRRNPFDTDDDTADAGGTDGGSDHDDGSSGQDWDPLSRVAMPRHCCLPGLRG